MTVDISGNDFILSVLNSNKHFLHFILMGITLTHVSVLAAA